MTIFGMIFASFLIEIDPGDRFLPNSYETNQIKQSYMTRLNAFSHLKPFSTLSGPSEPSETVLYRLKPDKTG